MISKKIVKKLVWLAELNEKERLLLTLLSQKSRASANSFITSVHLSESTAWHNLRSLRNKGLVDFGNGRNVSLTPLGRIVIENLEEV